MFTGLNTPEDFLRVIKNHRWLIICAHPAVCWTCVGGISMASKELSRKYLAQF